MLFINLFKYKLTLARVVDVIDRHEYPITWHEYEIHDTFGFSSSNYNKYNRDYDYGNYYHEIESYVYDYILHIEFKNSNMNYQSTVVLKNSSSYIRKNSRIIVYHERKNPYNVYVL